MTAGQASLTAAVWWADCELCETFHDGPHPDEDAALQAQPAGIEALDQDAVAAVVRAAAAALLAAWPEVDTTTELGQVLCVNAAILASRQTEALWQPDAHAVLFRPGRSLGRAGLVTNVAARNAELANTAAQRLGVDHPDTPAIRHELAYWRGMRRAAGRAAAAF